MAVQGCVERVNREKITGWVFDQQKPDRRYVVELYVGERQVAAAPATVARSDAARRGARKQTGFGFELPVPYGTQLDVAQIGVRVVGADIMLPVQDDAIRPEGVLDFVAGSTRRTCTGSFKKDQWAERLIREQRMERGLVGILCTLETCNSFTLAPDEKRPPEHRQRACSASLTRATWALGRRGHRDLSRARFVGGVDDLYPVQVYRGEIVILSTKSSSTVAPSVEKR